MFTSMLERKREAHRQQRNEEREMLETQRKIESKFTKLRNLEREAEDDCLKTIFTRKYAYLFYSLKLPHHTTYSKAKHLLLETGYNTAT